MTETLILILSFSLVFMIWLTAVGVKNVENNTQEIIGDLKTLMSPTIPEEVDAELIELGWSKVQPKEPGMYWFNGTIHYAHLKYEDHLVVYVVHGEGETTSVNEVGLFEQEQGDAIDYIYKGQWAKLEKPL